MITQEVFQGGARAIAPSSDYLIHPQLARVWRLNASGGAGVLLPDARTIRSKGALQLVISNVAVGSLPIKDGSGTTIVTLASGQSCLLSCLDNSTAAGSWVTSSKVHSIA